jgi:hypothetical protein
MCVLLPRMLEGNAPGHITIFNVSCRSEDGQDEVFWFVTQCGVVVGSQHFEGPDCLKMEAPRFSDRFVS